MLKLDQNARIIGGKVFVPNALSLIKDDVVYVLAPTAVFEESTGNYYLPDPNNPDKPTLLSEVVTNAQKQVFARATEFSILKEDDGTAVPFTLDAAAKVTDQGLIYTV